MQAGRLRSQFCALSMKRPVATISEAPSDLLRADT